jgi:hypothetical protein
MPAQQVIETVLKSGYTQVTKIEADDGHWEGEGVKNGQKMEFHADPKTGAIIREKPDHWTTVWRKPRGVRLTPTSRYTAAIDIGGIVLWSN